MIATTRVGQKSYLLVLPGMGRARCPTIRIRAKANTKAEVLHMRWSAFGKGML